MALPTNTADLANRTIQGVSWRGLSQAVTQGFTWIISIVLARILGPNAYGLVGMVAVFTSFAILFSGLGFGMAIVQRRNIEDRHLSTAFWMNAGMGTLITLAMFLVAPLIARFYHEPLLTPLTRVIALRFLFDSLDEVQSALLRREMRFRALGAIQIGSNVLSGVIALAMALSGMGVWSLVMLTLGFALFPLPILWRVTGWRPSWLFDWEACKELFHFSGPVVALDVVSYWAKSLDTLLIGRFMGPAALGIYSRAYSLMLMPLTQVSSVVGGVMMPALSAIQDDQERSRRTYLRVISLVGFVTFPMMVGLFVVADHLILALLGTQWVEVVPILRIMCGVGLLQSVSRTDWIYIPQGRTRLYFLMGMIVSIVSAFAFLIGIRWGITGMAWAYLACTVLMWPVNWSVAGHTIGLNFSKMVRALLPVFTCAAGMGLVVCGVRWTIPLLAPHWAKLAISIPIGLIAYLTLVASFRLEAWQQARAVFAQIFAGKLLALKTLLSCLPGASSRAANRDAARP